jgi:hypothetical protein
MATSMKKAAFWDVASCILAKIDLRFRRDPDDGGRKDL